MARLQRLAAVCFVSLFVAPLVEVLFAQCDTPQRNGWTRAPSGVNMYYTFEGPGWDQGKSDSVRLAFLRWNWANSSTGHNTEFVEWQGTSQIKVSWDTSK